jgi:protein gp37
MSEHSAISWTDSTWNCLAGCTRVSSGCDLCYAAQFAATRGKHTPIYKDLAVITPSGRPAFTGLVRYLPHRLAEPLRWQQGRRVFVNSMSDVFHDGVPDAVIDRIFAVMALTSRHTFQLLTKRPARMREYCRALTPERLIEAANLDAEGRLPFSGGHSLWRMARQYRYTPRLPLENVWLGVSVENQETADQRIPLLVETPAAVRWISAEPLLGPIQFSRLHQHCPTHDFDGGFCGGCRDTRFLDWVVTGGESGPGHRAMDVAWLESIADQCRAAGVPVFVKQDSGPKPGKQGRLSDRMWALKQFPGIPEAAHA